MRESEFQKKLIRHIKERLPDAIVLKQDPTLRVGVPDLLVLNGKHWAALECKSNEKQLNVKDQRYRAQHWYVDKMNDMSYASFVYPENEKEVLNDLERTLGTKR